MTRSKKPKLDAEALWGYALRLLGGRAMSSGEARQKIAAKAAEPKDVDAVLSKLKEYGYLNDERFAESYATARRDTQGFGKFRVVQDLRKRRVAPALAERVTTDAYADVDETEQASQYLERKYRAKNLPEFLREEKNLASAFRRLRAAGFGSGPAIRALKRHSRIADQLEDSEPEPEAS